MGNVTRASCARKGQSKMAPTIGPKMEQATDFVRENPGATWGQVARHVHPDNPKHGYPIVARAVAAGLVRATREGNEYKLHVVYG